MTLRGSSSTKTTERGRLKPARRSRQYSMMSSSVAGSPSPAAWRGAAQGAYYHRPDFLAPLCIRHAYHRRVIQLRVREQHLLHLFGETISPPRLMKSLERPAKYR